MAAKKAKIELIKFDAIEPDCDELGYVLFGICSTNSDVRMAWLLNGVLNVDFMRHADVAEEALSGENTLTYSIFVAWQQARNLALTLFTNRQREGLRLKEFSGIDYLLKISAPLVDINYIKEIGVAIRALPSVSACMRVSSPSLKVHPKLMQTDSYFNTIHNS